MSNALKYIRSLEAAGFERAQAEAQVQMVLDAIEGDLATKADLKAELSTIQAEFASVHAKFASVHAELDSVRGEFKTVRSEISAVRTELKSEIMLLKDRVESQFDRFFKFHTLPRDAPVPHPDTNLFTASRISRQRARPGRPRRD